MKKIINGKKYNTATAKEIGTWYSETNYSDDNYYEETLYMKKTGEFFFCGYGGGLSPYAQTCGENQWSGGSAIIPISRTEARWWIEEHMPAETYEEVFGPVEE